MKSLIVFSFYQVDKHKMKFRIYILIAKHNTNLLKAKRKYELLFLRQSTWLYAACIMIYVSRRTHNT